MMKKGKVAMSVSIKEGRVAKESVNNPIFSEEKAMIEEWPEIWTIVKK